MSEEVYGTVTEAGIVTEDGGIGVNFALKVRADGSETEEDFSYRVENDYRLWWFLRSYLTQGKGLGDRIVMRHPDNPMRSVTFAP